MRKAFVSALVELAQKDNRVVLLTGDLGWGVLDPFQREFPERFFNVGVAEQNLVGVATGLAEAGFKPYVYSIASFVCLRPYEFIKAGPLTHHLPITIVGVGGGLEYGHLGISHYALEDVALMRAQPGLVVVVPADAAQAYNATKMLANELSPVYLRLGKDDEARIKGLEGRFERGHIQYLKQGQEVAIVSMGPIASAALQAAERLEQEGVSCAVAVVSEVSPTPVEGLAELMKGKKLVVSVEVHYINGGLGSLLAEVMATGGLGGRLVRLGVQERPSVIGSQAYMESQSKLDAEGIAEKVRAALTNQQ